MTEILPKVDIMVVGATVAGCGATRALIKRGIRVAVLERAQVCAAEFADALFTKGDTAAYIPETEDGTAFCAELHNRGILTEHGVCLPAVAPVISARFRDCGATLYAPARIVEIVSKGDGYHVTFFSMGTEFIIQCGAIIDTTTSFVSGLWFGVPQAVHRRTLNANVLGKLPDTVAGIHGNRSDESFISVPVIDGDFDDAREALLRVLDGSEAKIIMTPMTAAESGENRGALCGTLYHLPSTYFGTVTAAYDAGVRLGEIWEGCGMSLPSLPVVPKDVGKYDVIVCGGGTAGAIAALTAAREGGNVLLVEDGVCLGGMETAGGVLGYYYGVPGGIYEEIDRVSQKMQKEARLPVVPMGSVGDFTKRVALGRALKEANVQICYEVTAVGVLRRNNRITGIRFRTNDGLCEARAAYVIDATADGVVALAAGAETMTGRACDGGYQPYSNVYTVYWESSGTASYGYVDNGIVDPYDPAAMGKAIIESGCANTHLWEDYRGERRFLGTAPRFGLREGRRIVGEETVKLEALLLESVSDEPVFWGYSNLDNHGKDNALEDSLCRRWNTVASMWGYNLTIPVPAGALIPRNLDGLLAAGRCIAVDHVVASAVRMKYDMQKSGEAAAYLAMESIRQGCPAKEVPYKTLRAKLLASGCLLESTVPTVAYISPNHTSIVMSDGKLWRDDPVWLRDVMVGNQPGYAIWSAAVHGEKLRNMLLDCLASENELLQRNAALALGLAGCQGTPCEEAIPHLLRMAADKSGRTVDSSRKYNYPYALSAAVLLELLGVRKAIDVLIPLVTDSAYTSEIPYVQCELTEDREDLAFQYFLQSFAALCGLYRRFPEEREKIAAAIERRIYVEDFHLSVTGKASKVSRIDYTEKIRKLWQQCCEWVKTEK